MSNVVVVGAQWGDEGKGKIVDLLTEYSDVIARYQGGHNAGHTVIINNEKFILHVIPSGILHRGKTCIIGNGMVVDPAALIDEIEGLKQRKIRIGRNLYISGRAHIIMPYHVILDGKYEESKGKKKIGTTGRGIGPAYVDKMSRIGFRMADLLDSRNFKEKLKMVISDINFLLKEKYNHSGLNASRIYSDYMRYADYLAPLITDTVVLINKFIAQGRHILFEGAQGTLLDIDHGTYPYVTSSNASAGGVCTGLGVSPRKINSILGVVKAYTTRVGGGPFPTELSGKLGEHLRQRGGEYGATTGRPRRCGWLDLVSLRHSMRINDFTGIAITKLDVLDGLEKIKVCTAYRLGSRRLREFPQSTDKLDSVEPVYRELRGWDKSTEGITDIRDLPRNARVYLEFIEDQLNTPVSIISTGQRRNEFIMLNNPFQ